MITHNRQTGVVLVIGLVFLLIMTITGISAIQRSTLQERMAANAGTRTAVFQAAEAALREGEDYVSNEDHETLKKNAINRFINSPDKRLPDPDATSWNGEIKVDEHSAFAFFYKGKSHGNSSGDESETTETGRDGFYYVFARAQSEKGGKVVLQSTINRRF